MLMSRLVFLLKHSRKINLSFLLVKRTIKPRPSGEAVNLSSTCDFLKSLLCFAREVASSVSEEDGGFVGGRTQFLPTVRPFPRTNP